jgi:hypothetical protein
MDAIDSRAAFPRRCTATPRGSPVAELVYSWMDAVDSRALYPEVRQVDPTVYGLVVQS